MFNKQKIQKLESDLEWQRTRIKKLEARCARFEEYLNVHLESTPSQERLVKNNKAYLELRKKQQEASFSYINVPTPTFHYFNY